MCSEKGKRNLKLSHWIDWTFMKLKCALPPLHMLKWLPDICSIPNGAQPWGSLPYSQVLSYCPAGTVQLLSLLWIEREGSFQSSKPCRVCLGFTGTIAHLFYKVACFVISTSSPKEKRNLMQKDSLQGNCFYQVPGILAIIGTQQPYTYLLYSLYCTFFYLIKIFYYFYQT